MLVFAGYPHTHSKPSLWVMSVLLFITSPALSGTRFDHGGSRAQAVAIDGALMLTSAMLHGLVREGPAGT